MATPQLHSNDRSLRGVWRSLGGGGGWGWGGEGGGGAGSSHAICTGLSWLSQAQPDLRRP